jgi:hypothetical protein
MIKHGISHAAVALTSVVAGEIIATKILDNWPAIEYKLAARLQPYLAEHNWHFDTHYLGALITIALFGFLWGAAFKHLSD